MTITGKTKGGFEFVVDKDVVDDMELIDDLVDADEGNPLAISRVCKRILGEEQQKQLYDYLRTQDGRVPVKETSEALIDIIVALGQEGKN